MEFILPFQIATSNARISYGQKIFFIGSCFSEEIGEHFTKMKFDVMQNPNGILYDPLSICYALNSYIENKRYVAADLFPLNEIWHSWHHHSCFSGTDKSRVLEKINQSQSGANTFLKNTSWIIITLGTAYNYQLKNNNDFVANCHKAPSGFFYKKLMKTTEIISNLLETIKNLQLYNSKLKIIFTISPVRHIKDGIVENNRSKARLIEAIHSINEQSQNVFYFPAFELVVDVLRDYRFYKSDMVHANETAVQYVFERFCNTFLDEDATKLMTEIKALLNAKNHQPFYKESAGHKNFLQMQFQKAQEIINKNPFIQLTDELKYFSGKI